MSKKAVLAVILLLSLSSTAAFGAGYGVYVQAVEKASGSFDDTVKKVESALEAGGWQVVKSFAAAVPEGCGFRAHTIVLHNAAYARKLLAKGPLAAFALPLRVMVFENEAGTNVAFVNPLSLGRTVLGEGAVDKLASETASEISAILTGAAAGGGVDRQLGQVRTKGKVGGMGGGDFLDKVKIIHQAGASATSLQEVAAAVKEGVRADASGWELLYTLDCVPQGVIILGVNKKATEARAYGIAGDKRAGKSNPCPGIDHAAAFPIEIVVFQEGDDLKVAILDEMYRMKVYFEDAGKWAFMKNMRMPGQIQDEIVGMSTSKLKK